ncbi:MAG: S9 family peptidase [Rikenellaceae bacterium]
MKKILLFMISIAAFAAGCSDAPQPLKIDNELTREEKKAALLTPEVMWKMGRVGSSTLNAAGDSLLYTITYYNMEENRGVTAIYLEDVATKSVAQLTNHDSNSLSPQWSADGQKIYFLSNRSGSMQVWSMSAEGKELCQVTDVDSGVEGFGVAPSGDKLFYVQSVKVAPRKSGDFHADMPKSKARIYDDLMVRHWSYWGEGEYLHIFVAGIDPKKGKATEGVDIIGANAAWDTPLAPYFDTGEIAWSNAGDKLAYTCKPLTGAEYAVSTDSDIYIYDVESARTENICKGEDRAAFVGYDKYPVWSPSDSSIAFISQRRAGNESDKERLFVYNFASKTMRDLTESFDYNASNVIWDGESELYFIAPIEATHQLCKVNLNGVVGVLTRGDHDINAVSVANNLAIAEVTKISQATELYKINLGTGEMQQYTNINKEIYDNIKMGEVQKRWVTTTDGKEMLTWVVLPPNFDPNKRYPTLLYCQGGPQSVVSQFWSYRWNFQVMAAQGYVVVAPNRRGLPSFGQEWLDQISGDYSGQNIEDYLAAIDDVAQEAWVDNDRLGCVGASYGGYSVYYLAGVHQGRFKAFISHCGIFNFEAMYGETEELFFVNNDYGGSYWDSENPTAVRSYENSPHKLVAAWDTPIMIITGEYDFRIPYTQSLQAFTAARLLGLDSRLVEFEDEGHQVFKPQNSLVWNREFFGWLDKYLK